MPDVDKKRKIAAAKQKLLAFQQSQAQRLKNGNQSPDKHKDSNAPPSAEPQNRHEKEKKSMQSNNLEERKNGADPALSVSSPSDTSSITSHTSELFVDEIIPTEPVVNSQNGNSNNSVETALENNFPASAESIVQPLDQLNGTAMQSPLDESSVASTPPTKINRSDLENESSPIVEEVQTSAARYENFGADHQKLRALCEHLEAEKAQLQWQNAIEINRLKKEIQDQMVTINILVTSKAERNQEIFILSQNLEQEKKAKNHIQGQLNEARQRMEKMERDLIIHNETVKKLSEEKSHTATERDELMKKLHETEETVNDNNAHIYELKMKLKNKATQCTKAENDLKDVNQRLDMAEILLQQRSGSEGNDQMKELQNEKEMLQHKVTEYNRSFERLVKEREFLMRRHQEIGTQLTNQVNDLDAKVKALEMEKATLTDQIVVQQDTIGKLQEENTSLKETKDAIECTAEVEELREQNMKFTEELNHCRNEANQTDLKLQEVTIKFEEVSGMYLAETKEVEQLRQDLEEANQYSDAYTTVVENIKNTKAALSTAVTQNEKLKRDLFEMQDGFVKLSNDKMELASQLSTSEFANKKLEENITALKSAVTEAEKQISSRCEEIEQLKSAFAHAHEQLKEAKEESPEQVRFTNTPALSEEITQQKEKTDLLEEQSDELKWPNLEDQVEETHKDTSKEETEELKLFASKLQEGIVESQETLQRSMKQNDELRSVVELLQSELTQSKRALDGSQPIKHAYVSQGDSAELSRIREELQISQETVQILGEQNNALKTMALSLQKELDQLKLDRNMEVSNQYTGEKSKEGVSVQKSPVVDDGDSSGAEELKPSTDKTIVDEDEKMLEEFSSYVEGVIRERDDLALKLKEQEEQYSILLEEHRQTEERIRDENETSKVEAYEQLIAEKAVLEERIASLLTEKTNALKRIDELEHINVQLQNECDTVGEYITLYHSQRQILKQRQKEKDDYVAAMARDREELRIRQEKLEELVCTFLTEQNIRVDSSLLHTVESGQMDDIPGDSEQTAGSSGRPDAAAVNGSSFPSTSFTPSSSSVRFPGKLERVKSPPSSPAKSLADKEMLKLLERFQETKRGNIAPSYPRLGGVEYIGAYQTV